MLISTLRTQVLLCGWYFFVLQMPLHAQSSRFDGAWVLFDQVSLSGNLYSNALPRMTQLDIAGDHIYFTNYDLGTQGQDTVIRDTCYLGRVYSRQYRANRYKEVTATWSDDQQSLLIDVQIYSGPDKTEHLFNSKYHYTLSNQQLTIIRDFENVTTHETWSCKGFFMRRDEE